MQFKRLTLLTLSALAVFTFLIIGCSKSSGGGSSSGISATVASSGFSPSTTVALYTQSGQAFDIGGYSIKSGDTTALAVTIPSPVTLNKALSTDNTPIEVEYYISGTKDYVAGLQWGSATVTVTSLDTTGHKIAGNFSGTLWNVNNSSDSIKVSNGQFNTSYLVEP